MPTREGALSCASGFFDGGGFRDPLAGLVAIPSTSQEPGREGVRPRLDLMGFTIAVHANPVEGFGPALTTERIEDQRVPTSLLHRDKLYNEHSTQVCVRTCH